MQATSRVGRNEPCPCGSGKKFKVCCEKRVIVAAEDSSSPLLSVGIAVLGVGLAVFVGLRIWGGDETPQSSVTSASTPAAGSATPSALPSTTTQPTPLASFTPQPPGPPPPGKVWAPEHGHWHDAPGASPTNAPMPVVLDANGGVVPRPGSNAPATLTPQPPGPVPDGKVWAPEHGHWHDLPPR